jgi:hypothetical protein
MYGFLYTQFYLCCVLHRVWEDISYLQILNTLCFFNSCRRIEVSAVDPVSMRANSNKTVRLPGLDHIDDHVADRSSSFFYPDR